MTTRISPNTRTRGAAEVVPFAEPERAAAPRARPAAEAATSTSTAPPTIEDRRAVRARHSAYAVASQLRVRADERLKRAGTNLSRADAFLARHPNVRLVPFDFSGQGPSELAREDLGRFLASPRIRAQLENISPDATIHLRDTASAVGTAIARPNSRHVFFNFDGEPQEIAIRSAGAREHRVLLRSLDQPRDGAVTSFVARVDRGVNPVEVLPFVVNEYSETPLALRGSLRTAHFHRGPGPLNRSTDDPNDRAGATAAGGQINFYDGAANIGLFNHELGHLIGQDAPGPGFVPDGYERAARRDGGFVNGYAEDASAVSGYTEDFAAAWDAYVRAIDNDTIKSFYEQFPARARWFEENLPRP